MHINVIVLLYNWKKKKEYRKEKLERKRNHLFNLSLQCLPHVEPWRYREARWQETLQLAEKGSLAGRGRSPGKVTAAAVKEPRDSRLRQNGRPETNIG